MFPLSISRPIRCLCYTILRFFFALLVDGRSPLQECGARAPPPQQVAQGAVAAAGGSAKLEAQRTSKIQPNIKKGAGGGEAKVMRS